MREVLWSNVAARVLSWPSAPRECLASVWVVLGLDASSQLNAHAWDVWERR